MKMVEEIKSRTKKLSLEIIRLCRLVPQKQEYFVISKQLIRSATSVAANYRAACRARSTAEFIAKLGIVEEEADESLFWLELLQDLNQMDKQKIETVYVEMNEILSIVVASKKSAKRNSINRKG